MGIEIHSLIMFGAMQTRTCVHKQNDLGQGRQEHLQHAQTQNRALTHTHTHINLDIQKLPHGLDQLKEPEVKVQRNPKHSPSEICT